MTVFSTSQRPEGGDISASLQSTTDATPDIDVCMATYNGAAFVKEQISSILTQLPPQGRLLISDDGSQDRTLSIIRQLPDPRIILLQGPRKGVVRNFEFLLTQSTANIIFLADQDDIWLPGRLDTMTEALGDADLVASNAKIIQTETKAITGDLFSWRTAHGSIAKHIARNGFVGCTIAFRRHLLNLALPFPPKIPMHDQWLGLIALRSGRVKVIDEPLLLYRRHAGTATEFKSSRRLLSKMSDRVYVSIAMLKLLRRKAE